LKDISFGLYLSSSHLLSLRSEDPPSPGKSIINYEGLRVFATLRPQ